MFGCVKLSRACLFVFVFGGILFPVAAGGRSVGSQGRRRRLLFGGELVGGWWDGQKKGGNPSFMRYTMILLILFAGYYFGVTIDLRFESAPESVPVQFFGAFLSGCFVSSCVLYTMARALVFSMARAPALKRDRTKLPHSRYFRFAASPQCPRHSRAPLQGMPAAVAKKSPPVGRESAISRTEAARAAAAIEAANPYLPLLPAWRQQVRRSDRDVLRNLKLELTTMEDQARSVCYEERVEA